MRLRSRHPRNAGVTAGNGCGEARACAPIQFMVPMHGWRTVEATHKPGRDGFHSVPNLMVEEWDAVERVPTRPRNWLARELNFKIHARIIFSIPKPAFFVKIRFPDVRKGQNRLSGAFPDVWKCSDNVGKAFPDVRERLANVVRQFSDIRKRQDHLVGGFPDIGKRQNHLVGGFSDIRERGNKAVGGFWDIGEWSDKSVGGVLDVGKWTDNMVGGFFDVGKSSDQAVGGWPDIGEWTEESPPNFQGIRGSLGGVGGPPRPRLVRSLAPPAGRFCRRQLRAESI